MRKSLTMVWIFILMSSGWASLLMGAQCPDVFYAHEVAPCKVMLITTGEKTSVMLYPHSAQGLFEAPARVETNADVLAVRVVELNIWARDAGSDALLVDAEFDGEKMGIVLPVKFTNPPLYAVVSRVDVEAGKRRTFDITLVGRGGNVRLWLESPNSSIEVSPPVDLGDVSGEEKANLYITTSPYYMGNATLRLHIQFIDKNGIHHLKYEIPISVAPSLYLLTGVALGLALILLVVFKLFKGKRSQPTEAQ